MPKLSPGLSRSLLSTLAVVLAAPAAIHGQNAAKPTPLIAHCVMGLDNVKRNAKGELKLGPEGMQFHAGPTLATVPISSIDDIYTGAEVSQSGGTVGTLTKVALPYGGGRALSLVLRNKLDVLTVTYRDPDRGYHGAIFTLPKGQGTEFRSQLVAAGAHASAALPPPDAGSQQEKK